MTLRLLKAAIMSSVEEAEPEHSGEASSISLADVAEEVTNLLSVEGEIHSEMLKALDTVGHTFQSGVLL